MSSDSQGKRFRVTKVALLTIAQTVFELISIISFIAINVTFIVLFWAALKGFVVGDYTTEMFIKKVLSSFELLFISPIPILIIFGFKYIMIKTYPDYFNSPEYDSKNILTLGQAKKTFIGSIIGVAATYILGIFINNEIETTPIIIVLFLLFILVLILYYKIINSHSEDSD